MTRDGLKLVSVSDLVCFDYCPRAVYLTRVLGLSPALDEARVRGMVEHAVRKELALREARMLKAFESGGFDSALGSEMGSLLSSIPHIYREWWRGEYSAVLDAVASEVSAESGVLKLKFESMLSDMGFEKALKHVTPWKMEYAVKSDSLLLSGRVDKIMDRGGLVPVELKTGTPPEGVRQSHRLQVCGYSMLLEEELGVRVPYGIVEYTRAHEERPVLNSEKLRREVVYARDGVFDVLGGGVPEVCPHGVSKKCSSCGLMEECYRI